MAETPPSTIRCPVCRARQEAQPHCRRCTADLVLYCQAWQAVGRTAAALVATRQRGDLPAAQAHWDYLNWLSPQAAAKLQDPPPTDSFMND